MKHLILISPGYLLRTKNKQTNSPQSMVVMVYGVWVCKVGCGRGVAMTSSNLVTTEQPNNRGENNRGENNRGEKWSTMMWWLPCPLSPTLAPNSIVPDVQLGGSGPGRQVGCPAPICSMMPLLQSVQARTCM